jgi:two-component system response regulator AtoC
MKILLVGQESKLSDYGSWIENAFDAQVQISDDVESLKLSQVGDDWDLLIVIFDEQHEPRELLRVVKDSLPKADVIAISDNAGEDPVGAMRMGVSDYFVAPVGREELLNSVRRLLEPHAEKTLPDEGSIKNHRPDGQAPLPEEVLFKGSSKMEALKQVVNKILDADLPVLITGESGTGKEMVARYVCIHSNRKGPFVKVNCAAIPSELLESELFGYERGAFTGAYRRKPGKFEVADGGFLFLDEISELSYPLQSKLLHVLQDGKVTTLGSTREVPVDVRILAATNQNLEGCVRNGTFRDDLFFRLNVVHLHVPPLRDRLEHLAVLIDYFCEKFAFQYNVRPIQLSPEARSFLYTYPWPGNIRELENAIRRATVLGGEDFLGHLNGGSKMTLDSSTRLDWTDKDIPSGKPSSSFSREPGKDGAGRENESEPSSFKVGMSLKEIAKEAALAAEREAIEKVLKQTRWNRKKTAKILDVSYKTLLTKIKETGLDEN